MEARKVSDIVFEIKNLLENNFGKVLIEGEISNWSQSGAGHVYFSLGDEKASLSAVLFKGDRLRNPLAQKLKTGDQVFCWGEVSLYAARGTVQLIVRQIFSQGEGLAKFQLEQLKNKLEQEGLFRFEHKKNIPENPLSIAVITAEQGAALQDFISVYSRRSVWGNLFIFPAIMQGKASVTSIKSALGRIVQFSQEKQKIDCIVLTRGGGSQEDLSAFNDESLVRAVFACPIPLISAIGHEVDYSLVDYVADDRAETPSAAAEMLSRFQDHFLGRMRHLQSSLIMRMQKLLLQLQKRVYEVSPLRAYGLLKDKLMRSRERLSLWQRKLQKQSADAYAVRADSIKYSRGKLLEQKKYLGQRLKGEIDQLKNHLDQFDSQKILAQGYVYLKSEQNFITSTDEFDSTSDPISLCFRNGKREVIKNEN